MEKLTGLYAGTWAVKEGQVGSQRQVEKRGRPAEAGRNGGHRHEAARQAGRVTKAGRGGSSRALEADRQAKETG
jgi:hypothetical protein